MNTDKEKFEKKKEILAEYARQVSEKAPEFAGLEEKGDFEGAFHEFCLHIHGFFCRRILFNCIF